MERVTFLIERTGEQITCLLNPEALEMRRSAGVASRRDASGAVLGTPRADDPLIATGGGVTEYDLKLLFDVDLIGRPPAPIATPAAAAAQPAPTENSAQAEAATAAPAEAEQSPPPPGPPAEGNAAEPAPASAAASEIASDVPVVETIDVRERTQRIWALAETAEHPDGSVALPLVRFVWGKSWDVPAVVVAVAERLERFDRAGVPQRSWMSLRLRRVAETEESAAPSREPTTPQFQPDDLSFPDSFEEFERIEMAVDADGYALTRYDHVGAEIFGDPRAGRMLLEFNDVDDLLRLPANTRLRAPSRSRMRT